MMEVNYKYNGNKKNITQRHAHTFIELEYIEYIVRQPAESDSL